MAYSVPAQANDPVETLTRALEARITVYRNPNGRVVHVRHCRASPQGCRARVAQLARWIVEVSQAHEVDPWVLAAMAVRESGLNPFAIGRAGERGVVQLHPQGSHSRGITFVRSEGYRRRCARQPGACQREILDAGAQHLSQWVRRCGSLEAALGGYNRGACGATDYTVRVLRERDRLLRLAGVPTAPLAGG
jgi:soluble lytic murein transglycosylase-like protein